MSAELDTWNATDKVPPPVGRRVLVYLPYAKRQFIYTYTGGDTWQRNHSLPSLKGTMWRELPPDPVDPPKQPVYVPYDAFALGDPATHYVL